MADERMLVDRGDQGFPDVGTPRKRQVLADAGGDHFGNNDAEDIGGEHHQGQRNEIQVSTDGLSGHVPHQRHDCQRHDADQGQHHCRG
jgi:hypothetical protein